MGLSSKQVISSDGHGWNNSSNQGLLEGGKMELQKPPSSMKRQLSNEQQPEILNCPRCDSTNTKFCYYNNYNKSQPRHFCKACKRHWTKGGTLRNVRAGGGRKNKRVKTSNKTSSKNTTTSLFSGISSCNYNNTTIPSQQPRLGLPITSTVGGDQKNFSEAFYQLGGQPCSSLPEGDNGIFLGSTLSLLQNDQDPQFPYSNLGIFESNPCSISSDHQSPNLYSFTRETNGFEETGMHTTSLSSSSMSDHHQNWEIPTSNWGWDDLDKFVSVEADLAIPWDDAEIKP